jgi:hypothetical protein
MIAKEGSLYKLSIAVGLFGFAVGLLAGLNVLISGLPTPGLMTGFVDDWSHHHVVYTNPGTAADALAQGRFEQWYVTANNPRYIMQEMRRHPMLRAMEAAPDFASRMALLRSPSVDSDAMANARRPPEVTLTNDWNVDVGPIGVGTGNFPAKFSFNGGVSASDLAVFNTSEPGSGTSATLIGLDNLYVTSPTVAFAYNTTTGDTVATSVVFNYTGNQIAFVSTNGGSAYLNVLRFEIGSGNGTAYGSAVTPSTVTASAGTFTTCKSGATSCLFRAKFANGASDTRSSPYYDYASDTLWVGDNLGYIHEFTNVFNGSVAEKLSSGTTPWMSTGATTVLTSPVFDGTYVYVGAANGDVYAFTVSSGAKYATSAALTGGGLGLTDSPLLDVAAGFLYEGIGYDASHDSGITRVNVPALTSVSEVYFGGSSTTVPVFSGTFDNSHYLDGGTTGYITTCNAYTPNYYFNPIALSGFVAGTRTLYSSVTGDHYVEVASSLVTCSPQTEVLNGTHDYIFLSVASHAHESAGGCTAGTGIACVYGFTVGNATTYTWTGTAPTAGMEIPENTTAAQSSTSGIIIDNTAAGGGSNVYFTTNATTNGSPCSSPATAGCAIQVTQSAL